MFHRGVKKVSNNNNNIKKIVIIWKRMPTLPHAKYCLFFNREFTVFFLRFKFLEDVWCLLFEKSQFEKWVRRGKKREKKRTMYYLRSVHVCSFVCGSQAGKKRKKVMNSSINPLVEKKQKGINWSPEHLWIFSWYYFCCG